jgi:replication factor C large subunit
MDETLRVYFSAKSLLEASTLLSRSNVDYDDFLLSVGDNLPRRYEDPEELGKAYDFVSRADMFRGRIGTEHWNLLRYFFNDMARAAAVSPESYKPFEFIFPPIRIITLFGTKGKRIMLENISSKIGLQCHTSRITAKNDFVLFIKAILEKQKAHSLAAWFKFDPEEVEYLLKMNKF